MKRIILPLCVSLLILPAIANARINKPVSFIELRTKNNELQSHQYSCGATSLASLLTIFGKPTSEEELINEIFPTKRISRVNQELLEVEPLSLKDLEDLSRNRGLKVVSLQALDEKSAYNALTDLAPIITRIRVHDDVLHFVLVKSVANGWVYIGDPGYGNIHLPWNQFYPAFNEGKRIFLSISTEPFMAKVNLKDKTISIKRVDKRDPDEVADNIPKQLIDAARKTIRFNNSF
ncbi:MAG: hypothetical protein C1942_06290 [Prosthecochloris sp.]|uniref:C39 family peptidase n=1 Tax=Prosthecochloris sp. TaxID=290513 RepID=UPI0013CDDC78|nr:cysteine peptidase family C39 domain-containing protein [Prosthecochloris sp.]NEX12290.1 hypothetical protein [Prosthecochloris sp.]